MHNTYLYENVLLKHGIMLMSINNKNKNKYYLYFADRETEDQTD